MLPQIKNFLLTHEPFKPAHMGTWIRGFYFRYYIKKYVSVSQLRNTLDGACGNGQYAYLIASWAPVATVKGVDLLESNTWEKFTLPNLSFAQMDLNTLDEENKEDLIVSIDTIEHILHNEVILQNFFHALRPSGVLYLTVPCKMTNIHIFPQSWFGPFHTWEDKEHIGEQRPLPELVLLLQQIGFHVDYARNTFTLWGALAWEVEKLLSWGGRWSKVLNILLMPLYKFLAVLDLFFPIGTGDNLVIARKL